ncbi:hypothetical protein CYMTET_41413 [Cymbomonas tetramitiformis]|uniref:Uncharacterized protein n=1 Tax=Cymbomonas tetramitiformis TaxID=36881 RepID=A0AAE0C863_9CHLO|nr:hypothetical protein CYMTET_41413 [Cymbomonas tetramitiformis]
MAQSFADDLWQDDEEQEGVWETEYWKHVRATFPNFDSVESAVGHFDFGTVPVKSNLRKGVQFTVNDTRLLVQQSSRPSVRSSRKSALEKDELRYLMIVQQIEVEPAMRRKGRCTETLRALIEAAAKRQLDVMVQCVHNKYLAQLLCDKFGATNDPYADDNYIIHTERSP